MPNFENCPSYRNFLGFPLTTSNGPIGQVSEPISVGNSYRMGSFPAQFFLNALFFLISPPYWVKKTNLQGCYTWLGTTYRDRTAVQLSKKVSAPSDIWCRGSETLDKTERRSGPCLGSRSGWHHPRFLFVLLIALIHLGPRETQLFEGRVFFCFLYTRNGTAPLWMLRLILHVMLFVTYFRKFTPHTKIDGSLFGCFFVQC